MLSHQLRQAVHLAGLREQPGDGPIQGIGRGVNHAAQSGGSEIHCDRMADRTGVSGELLEGPRKGLVHGIEEVADKAGLRRRPADGLEIACERFQEQVVERGFISGVGPFGNPVAGYAADGMPEFQPSEVGPIQGHLGQAKQVAAGMQDQSGDQFPQKPGELATFFGILPKKGRCRLGDFREPLLRPAVETRQQEPALGLVNWRLVGCRIDDAEGRKGGHHLVAARHSVQVLRRGLIDHTHVGFAHQFSPGLVGGRIHHREGTGPKGRNAVRSLVGRPDKRVCLLRSKAEVTEGLAGTDMGNRAEDRSPEEWEDQGTVGKAPRSGPSKGPGISGKGGHPALPLGSTAPCVGCVPGLLQSGFMILALGGSRVGREHTERADAQKG